MWEILLYGFVSFLITYPLYRNGRFKVVRKTETKVLTILNVILLFVDVVETWVGFEHEVNPIVTLIGWTPFVLSHVALIIPMVLLGWKSMSEEEVIARAALFGVVIYFVILTVMNALSLWIYSFF